MLHYVGSRPCPHSSCRTRRASHQIPNQAVSSDWRTPAGMEPAVVMAAVLAVVVMAVVMAVVLAALDRLFASRTPQATRAT